MATERSRFTIAENAHAHDSSVVVVFLVGIFAVNPEPHAGGRLVRFSAGSDLFRLHVNRLPQSSKSCFPNFAFMRHVRGDARLPPVGKGQNAIVAGSLGIPHLNRERAGRKDRAQRERKREPQPSADRIPASSHKAARRDDPPQRRPPRVGAGNDSCAISKRRPQQRLAQRLWSRNRGRRDVLRWRHFFRIRTGG